MAAIVYEEFEPLCKWQRSPDQDILEIHLQDFKKEQLKVQISNLGILKVSGERALDAPKHTKFYKEIHVPNTKYDTQSIHAKFVNSNLIITLPKLKAPIPHEEINDKVAPSQPSKADQTPKSEPTTGAPTECPFERRERPTVASRLTNVAVSLAAVAVLVAYVVYMYKSMAEIVTE